MITALLTLFTAITAVFMRDRLTAGTVGLMITYVLQITNSLNILVRVLSEVETHIVSVERINEYAQLSPEAPWEISETKPPPHWPTSGNIQYAESNTCLKPFNIDILLESRICPHDIEKICSWYSKI
jgi:ABC-type multidrug transport system fused ATPase/permease subunit